MREKRKMDETKVPRRFSSNMDVGVHERNDVATAATKIPSFLVLLGGLDFSMAPRVIWAILDIGRQIDTLHTVNTSFAGATTRTVCYMGRHTRGKDLAW